MADPRRPSLIDQMAMVAASQALLMEGDFSDSGSEEEGDIEAATEESGEDLEVEDDEEMEFQQVSEDDDDSDGGGSVPSHVGSEHLDEFAEDPTPLDFEKWQSRPSQILEESDLGSFSAFSATESLGSQELTMPGDGRHPSLQPMRRASRASHGSSSDNSFHSAPARAGQDTTTQDPDYGYNEGIEALTHGGSMQRRRPLSIAVPNAQGVSSAKSSFRRKNINSGSLNFAGGTEDNRSVSSGSSGLSRFSRFRSNLSLSRGGSTSTSSAGNLENAIESLKKKDSNSEWENVAAAVAVAAATSQGTSNTPNIRHIKFAVNDTVLAFLPLLNFENEKDPDDVFTVAPVNKYGFPLGEGRSEAEKVGPYNFVLATVKHVHFDEDDRYYTVVRADTGTEQRADSGWIQPLHDPVGIEAASRAAKRTFRSAAQDEMFEEEYEPWYLQYVDCVLDVLSWPADFMQSTMLPWYRKQRNNAKQIVTHLLYGDAPFACKVRLTGINILVFCSIVFLFLEVANLAFLPAEFDQEVAIVGTVIWSILVLELLFEVLIRPKGYSALIESDKAFAPSTARHINSFHLVFETLALATFIPEFSCISDSGCQRNSIFSRVQASMDSILGETKADAARGRFLLGLTTLRLFSVVRHWKKMWIHHTSRPVKREGIEKWLFSPVNVDDSLKVSHWTKHSKRKKKKKVDDTESAERSDEETKKLLMSSEEDHRLENAATIGTVLMVVNSQRVLVLVLLIVSVFSLENSFTQRNLVSKSLVDLLQANNLAAPTNSTDDCDYLESAVNSWIKMAIKPQPASFISTVEDTFVLWAQLLPVRCDFQNATNGVITFCGNDDRGNDDHSTCMVWDEYFDDNVTEFCNSTLDSDCLQNYFASELHLRQEAVTAVTKTSSGVRHTVTVVYNQSSTVSLVNMGLFFLMLSIMILILYGLQALRNDAVRLVLDPLRRVLKIAHRYAENPLAPDARGRGSRVAKSYDTSAIERDTEEIGSFETEQLINAITKIADLLRKCWGVAGAGIISSNLARTKDGKTFVGFNPTVPGKRVYALFGFVAINGFSEQLRALDRDVMILINDVAKVVHDEVYRWALGDHGQCNKNLGSAFLMVFRIGDFSEVQKKKQVATEKLFRDTTKHTSRNANIRRRYRSSTSRPYGGRRSLQQEARQLQLASLPGIQAFTDRALLGMLKSFAGVHRDRNLNVWRNDFRLSGDVKEYHVDIIYGMDAGWAVEGAVGSEYKIDATYLSPHVNMAARMMSATKQYGVTILLSKAVEELLSKTCRRKLRHLDTVYVKGSKVKQEIFTFDARYSGVDFFLLERTPEQADVEAESYTQAIWDQDQDLKAMRQHVSEGFVEIFDKAVKQYLAGQWKEAYKNFEAADDMMIKTVLEDGYLEYDIDELEGRIDNKNDQSEDILQVRKELGDGPCRALMAYMEKRNFQCPKDWDSVRQLFSK